MLGLSIIQSTGLTIYMQPSLGLIYNLARPAWVSLVKLIILLLRFLLFTRLDAIDYNLMLISAASKVLVDALIIKFSSAVVCMTRIFVLGVGRLDFVEAVFSSKGCLTLI